MRVLHVINSLQLGGAEALLSYLVPHLHRRGMAVVLYVLNRTQSPLEQDLVTGGAKVYFSGRASVYSAAHVLHLARHLRHNRYDLGHVHLFPSQLWTAFAARMARLRIPLVTTEHNTHNRRRKPWFRPLDRWMYRQYEAIACNSEATASELVRWLPELARKVHVVRNGIPIEHFREASALCKTRIVGEGDCPIVLSVARFSEQKDHGTLLRALARVPEAHLVLVGDGATRAEMEAATMALGIGDRVHFLGRRQDVPQLIKMADIYVQSSHWEGFGIATVEAMAGGLPVVVSRVPGLADVVGDAGLLFEPGDDQQLAECLNALLQNPQLRSEMGKKSLACAAKFSIEHTADEYVAFYNRVLSTSRGS